MPAQNIDVVLRLLNGRRFNTAMNQSAASVRAAKTEMEAAAAAGSGLGVAGHTAAGGLNAVNAAARVAGYGIGALAIGYVGLGISFNATMESNALALTHFAGGAEQAKTMTKQLFDIARDTPFSFTDITTAARKFLAYGFSVGESVEHLKTMGDTLAYVGGNASETIPLFAKAVGQIRQMGRLRQQELNQLTNLGINPIEAFKQGGLELTKKQLENVGRAGIDADTALKALFTGLDKIYGGGSEAYLDTFNGQWQRLTDNIKAAAGTSTTGIFGGLKNVLKDLNAFLEGKQGQEYAKTLKTVLEGAIMIAGAAFLFLKERVEEFMAAIAPAQPYLQNVLLPLLKGLALGILSTVVVAWKIFIFLVKYWSTIIGTVSSKLGFLKGVFFAIGYAASFVFGGEFATAAKFLMRFGGLIGKLGLILHLLTFPFRLVSMAVRGMGNLFIRFASRPLPIFRAGLDAVIKFLTSLPGRFLSLGLKIGKGLLAGILGAFAAAGGFAGKISRSIADWLNAHTPFGDTVNLGFRKFKIPALASGGYIMGGGYAMVGEQGPEMVRLPAGASVIPNHAAQVRRPNQESAASRGQVFEGAGQPSIVKVYIGRRQIAEAVGEEVASKRARG